MGGAGAIGLAGCVSSDDSDDSETTPEEEQSGVDPSEIGSGTFVASSAANPGTFDPTIIADATSNATVGTMCYESLIGTTFDLGEFRGELAESFEQVDDTTFRFQLREGVTFHNGDEFTAADVLFSINRTSGTTNDADVSFIENVEQLGEFEVEITSTDPHAPFLTDLSAVPIVPSGVDGVSTSPSEDDHRFDEETLGTGPFVLDEFSSEDRVVLTPYEDYWYEEGDTYPGTAPWDEITIRIITEQVSQEEAMAAGELGMIDNAAPFELDQWESKTGEVVSDAAVGFDFITYPVKQEPYTNQKFRRGIARLLPRSDIIEAIFGGNATALGGPISPGLGAYWDPEHEQGLLDEFVGEDADAATQLLEEAFQEVDVEPPLDISMITNVNRTRERWMEVVQQTLDDTKFFNAELDVRAFSDLVPFLLDPEGAAASQDIVGIGWTGGSDPNGHIEQLLDSSQHVPDGFNWNLYENSEVDQLIADGQVTLDVEERRQIYFELQELLAEDSPLTPMWTGDKIDVLNPSTVESTADWQPHPNSSYRYHTLYSPHLDQMTLPPQ